MANNYNILAKHIVSKYSRRVSGSDINGYLIGEEPAKRVMVGMLAENRVKNSLTGGYKENSETRFESVPSISVTFVVKKEAKGSLHIIPQGLLFYSVAADYEKTLAYVLQTYSEKDRHVYANIQELCDVYADQKFPLPRNYKSIDIAEFMGEGIELQAQDFKTGKRSLESQISAKLSALTDRIMNEIRMIPDMSISFFDLADKDRFKAKSSAKEGISHPNWTIDILCSITEEKDSYRFLLQMVNNTVTSDNMDTGYVPKIFNAGIKIVGDEGIVFQDIELDYFKNSYKARQPIYAIAENTSAKFLDDENAIQTDNIPIYYQDRLRTKDQFNQYITFERLISNPVENLRMIHSEMMKDYEKREQEFFNTTFSSPAAKMKFQKDLNTYQQEISRFEKGIKQIEFKDWVKKAFVYMNQTFSTEIGTGRSYPGWRLFQIVFIVSLISEMIRSEYKDDSTLAETDIEVANLLYFPTGGGKTEAFLGCCVFSMFFDRLRGKNYGITALLKYPLRLLAVQQLERVLVVVMKANIVRESIAEIKNTPRFEVGFFVGKANTPNSISSREQLSDRGDSSHGSRGLILESDEETLNEYYRFIDTCPICGKKHISMRFNKTTWKLEHYCDNPECKVDELPLRIVDNEIYRYLPSIVVSTIDKMAMLGTTNEFKMLFGQVKKWCPVHGFSCQSRCLVEREGCSESLRQINELKDPVPTLFIQDEMHLVKESLGTFDAHYESFANYYAKNLVPENQRKQIRFIGATATISMYEEHIKHLYHMAGRRFPCEYPSMTPGGDFYSYTDNNDVTRIILGYAPYGRSITNGMWESVYMMRTILYSLMTNIEDTYRELVEAGFEGSKEELQEMLYDYWIELVYNNRKQDAMELENSFRNQANNFLEEKGIPLFNPKQMTSDVDFQDVRKTLFDVQANRKNLDSTNLILATSTISHGVDEDSFNIMYFFGMPNNNAEYIQAYSRTGRKYTGIVIDIIRLMRIRDRSYLKNFVVFHQNKDDLVEGVPINRWAKNAIYSTLPGVLSAILMQYYTIENGLDSMYKAVDLKKLLLEGKIREDEVISHLVGAYACNGREKLSLAYKEVIEEQVHKVLDGIANGNFTKDDFLSDAIAKYTHGKKRPMISLRDTEEQIEIKI
ncbi:DEAD/DEAH box helicase family protein [Oribacterium sp. WCC10]|uniref:DEAD/DEAH box helicase family protein n=1 Tax=Oribacterium sp. WCC10 TaxID=1855343 RepID=UPI0008E97233|nr:DEAD/DEAH box helicase family protein [Oribacterium sp. WCC10]SFG77952.1 Helicase conserved C-terminal domain-containing protein [Oribacterium sp. WCC10]